MFCFSYIKLQSLNATKELSNEKSGAIYCTEKGTWQHDILYCECWPTWAFRVFRRPKKRLWLNQYIQCSEATHKINMEGYDKWPDCTDSVKQQYCISVIWFHGFCALEKVLSNEMDSKNKNCTSLDLQAYLNTSIEIIWSNLTTLW